LNFLRAKYPTIPANAVGAIFFEQETNETNELYEIISERRDNGHKPWT